MNSFLMFFVYGPIILILYEVVSKFLFQNTKSNTNKNHPNNHRVTNQQSKIQQSTIKSSTISNYNELMNQPLADDYLLPIFEELKNEKLITMNYLVEAIVKKMKLSEQQVKATMLTHEIKTFVSNRFDGLYGSISEDIRNTNNYLVKRLNKEIPVYYVRILEAIAYLKEAGYVVIEHRKTPVYNNNSIQRYTRYFKITSKARPSRFDCNHLLYIIDSNKSEKNYRYNGNFEEFEDDSYRNELDDEMSAKHSPWNDVPSTSELFNEGDLD